MPDYPFGEGKSLPHNRAKAKAAIAGATLAGVGKNIKFKKELNPLKRKSKSTKPGMYRRIMTDMKTGKSDTTYSTPTPITLEEFQ